MTDTASSAKPSRPNNRAYLAGAGVALTLAVVVLGIGLQRRKPRVMNFDQCVRVGYPVDEGQPQICRTPDGRSFAGASQDGSGAADVINYPFEILVSGGNAADSGPASVVVRDQAEWEALWESLHRNVDPRPPLLKVDFSKEMVIGVIAGQRPSGGYSIKVLSVVEEAGRVLVHVQETEPGASCVTTQALTNPYHLVRTTKTEKPIDFETEKEVKNCR